MDFFLAFSNWKNSASVFKHSQKIGHGFSCIWQPFSNFSVTLWRSGNHESGSKKIATSVFSQIWKIGQRFFCTRRIAMIFPMVSWLFHHSEKFKRLTAGFLQFVNCRIQWKSQFLWIRIHGSGHKKTNTCLNVWLFTNSESEPLNPGKQMIKLLK